MGKEIRGKVFTGQGEGAFFSQLDWVKEQCRQKLGFVPYPGTLNLRVEGPYLETVKGMRQGEAPIQFLPPSPEFCPAKCYRVALGGVRGALVIPLAPNYPADVIEVWAPVKLKEALSLKDGDVLAIRILS